MSLAAPGERTGFSFQQFLILITVQLATVLFGMTTTLANVLLPQMRGALSATQDQIALVVTFNIVATAVATPVTGWLAARLGWRRLMAISLFGFAVTSVACGLAQSLGALVVFRVLQGAFGGPIMPMGQAILLASFPPRQHALVTMLWGIGGVFGPVLGPLLGGAMAEAYSWRAAFFMTAPFAVLALLGVLITLDDRGRLDKAPLDWTGFIALSLAIAAAQYLLDRGQRLDWFDSIEIVAVAAVAIIAFYIFLVHSLSSKAPFLDLRIFLNRDFALGVVLAGVFGMLVFTPMVLFPPLLQELRGFPESIIGTLISARGLGNWVSFLMVVPLTNYSPRLALAIGFAASAIAGWGMASLDINLTLFDVFWTNMLQGFGIGMIYVPMSMIAFSSLQSRQLTEASAIFHLVRNFGSSVFISLSVTLYIRSTADNYARLAENVNPFNQGLAASATGTAWNMESAEGLASIGGEVFRQAAMIGYLNAFNLYCFTALATLPLLLLVRRRRR